MATGSDIRPPNPLTLLSAVASTGAGSWVTIGRALPTRVGLAVKANRTATVQLQGRIDTASTFAVSVGAATTMASGTPRVVTLSTALPAVAQVRARITAIGGSTGTVTVRLAI